MNRASGVTAGTYTEDTAWTELLRGIVAIASEERSLRSVLRETAKLVVAVTGADACFVHVVDHDAGEVVLMGATPEEFDELADTIRLALGQGIAGWVAQNGEPAVVEDKWSDPRYRYIPALRGEDFNSLVSIPLLRPRGEVVGVLNVHARQPGHFAGDVLARLTEVARLLAGIVETALLHEQVRRHEEQLARFAVRTIELQELERRQMAGNIHDGISQRLVSAWYHVRAAGSVTSEPAVIEALASVASLLSDALDEARRAITGLRPSVLDDLGLTAALNSLAASAGGFAVDLDLQECHLPPHVETSLYRIAQEALQNVVKHAEAAHVTVSLRLLDDGSVVFTVRDDGIGFDPGSAPAEPAHNTDLPGGRVGFGVTGMQERAGLLGATLRIRSQPGQGTVVSVRLPPVPSGERRADLAS